MSKARSIVFQAIDRRPYFSDSAYLALLTLGPQALASDIETLFKTGARLNPLMLDGLYQWQLANGRYAEAVALYPELVPARPYDQNKSAFQAEQSDRLAAERFWASRGGECAYALAVLGRAGDARAMLAATRDRFDKAIQAPPEPVGEETLSDRTRRVLVANTGLQINAAARPLLDEFDRLVDLRLQVAAGHAPEVLKALPTAKLSKTWAVAELIESIGRATPGQAAAAAAAAQQIRAQLAVEQPSVPSYGLADLAKRLPEAETAQRLPAYSAGGAGLLVGAQTAKNNPFAQRAG
jgi:hypothetical protein